MRTHVAAGRCGVVEDQVAVGTEERDRVEVDDTSMITSVVMLSDAAVTTRRHDALRRSTAPATITHTVDGTQ